MRYIYSEQEFSRYSDSKGTYRSSQLPGSVSFTALFLDPLISPLLSAIVITADFSTDAKSAVLMTRKIDRGKETEEEKGHRR
jgi:hypothetical protein